ncbi:hypothetical protein V6Z12_A01G145100 [Gossypium hirsutum]
MCYCSFSQLALVGIVVDGGIPLEYRRHIKSELFIVSAL